MLKTITLSTSLLLTLFLSTDGYGDDPPTKPISESESVLAIYTQNDSLGIGNPGPEMFSKLIVAVWGDGTIVWSDDRLNGGMPYRSARIDPKKVKSLLAGLKRDGAFDEKSLQRGYLGPDSHHTVILVRFENKQLEMSSWHELYEGDSKRIALSYGLTLLDNRQRYQALKDEPSEYLLFRMVWSDIRARAAELIPSAGVQIGDKLVMKGGILSLQGESAAKEKDQPKSGDNIPN